MAHVPQILVVPHSERFTEDVAYAVAELRVDCLTASFPIDPTKWKVLERAPTLAVVDMLLPDLAACSAVTQIRERWPSTPIILTAPRPFLAGPDSPRVDALQDAIATALLAAQVPATELLGTAPPLKEVADALPRLGAVSTSTILLRGESGVGKSLLAHHLHRSGRRRDQPFIRVCCEAAPAELVQHLLFGHESPNGIVRPGLLEAASGGIVYLDEAIALGPSTQARLLRASERGAFKCLGGTKNVPLQTSIIGATTRMRRRRAAHDVSDLDLNAVVELRLPPLRAHLQDVPQLAQRLAAFVGDDSAPPTFAPDALDAMSAYSWPGNLRELLQVITRMMAHPSGPRISVSDLPPVVRFHPATSSPPHTKQAAPGAARAEPERVQPAKRGSLLHFPTPAKKAP